MYFLLIGSFFYLFVCVDPNSGTVLSKMRNFLFKSLPDMLKRTGRKVFGDGCVDRVERMIQYICFSTNPIVQILYLFLAVGGFFIYVQVGFNRFIPGPYISSIHKPIGTAIMILCYISFLLASWTNPGVIKKSNLKQTMQKFPYDGLLYVKGEECRTCK